MNDQQAGQENTTPKQEPDGGRIIWCIRQIQNALQERKRRKQDESAQDRAARRTATATWWIAGFTLVAVGVGISQAIIANRTLVAISGQLTEMQSSSEQVERSIKASNRIADESTAANALTAEANTNNSAT